MTVPRISLLPWLAALLALGGFAPASFGQLRPDGATASFRGSLPPPPVAALDADQEAALESSLASLLRDYESVSAHPRAADAAIFLKAVRYALDFDEWYDKKAEDGVAKAELLLAEARTRIDALRENRTPWMDGPGPKVLGYFSRIDGSPQPYGVDLPEGLERGPDRKAVPMWIWLHGRGDTQTDLHFVHGWLRGAKPGPFRPASALVIHPFGRYCNGWKSAGETDVFEARDDASARFHADPDRIALGGFSMGGAGAWHLGAHFADQWACVHTGAGFVDVKRYQKLTPDRYPPWYEQVLWHVYDVPSYARNFHNVPLLSYSGETDPQRDSAEYMTEVLAAEGIVRPHLIGPGTGHKYHPDTLREVQGWIEDAVARGRDPDPDKVVLQTRCTRYGKMFWVRLGAPREPWEDTRIEAERDGAAKWVRVSTKNVAVFRLDLPPEAGWNAVIDGQEPLPVTSAGFVRDAGTDRWQVAAADLLAGAKGWGIDGGIDEAFQEQFLVVLPDGPGWHPATDAWVEAESKRFLRRWRSLMRGEAPVKKASEVTGQEEGTWILWGDPKSNRHIGALLPRLPFPWTAESIEVSGRSHDASSHVPVLSVGWREGAGTRRVVLNSGLTFREAHDRTNSLQNPKLPDWTVLRITEAPDAERAGAVAAAGFSDGQWRVKP
jgi:predicted esterase